MSAEDPNPAATPTPCEDTQGDGRWISLVCKIDNLSRVLYSLSFVFYINTELQEPCIENVSQSALLLMLNFVILNDKIKFLWLFQIWIQI